MVTVLLNFAAVCFPFLRDRTTLDHLKRLIPFLCKYLLQESTSMITPSFLPLVDSGILFLLTFFHLSMTWTLSRREFQDTSPEPVLEFEMSSFFFLSGVVLCGHFIFVFLFFL